MNLFRVAVGGVVIAMLLLICVKSYARVYHRDITDFAMTKETSNNLRTLLNAKKGDVIYFYVYSRGGAVHVLRDYEEYISRTNACVIAKPRKAYSAGFIILGFAHHVDLSRAKSLMIHVGRYNLPDGGIKLIPSTYYWIEQYLGILTKKEKARVKAGEDVYITGKQARYRTRNNHNIRVNPFSERVTDVKGNCRGVLW